MKITDANTADDGHLADNKYRIQLTFPFSPIAPRRARTTAPAEDGWLQWIYTIVTLPVQFAYSTLYELIAFLGTF